MNDESDLELLQRYEPVLRFNRGEHFFPAPVEPFVNSSSLWVQSPLDEPICLVPEGELTIEKLGENRSSSFNGEPGSVFFLKYVNPLDVLDLVTYTQRARRADKARDNVFRAGWGRLARVGYVSRFVDAFFSLSLLARGRVSGDTAAAARIHYDKFMEREETYQYYGRVRRQDGWTVLQYWFFYYFNNWRSGFFGVNDHEADWEMVSIYLAEAPGGPAEGQLVPQWVAYASHDYKGDDLRRRWDDPEVEKYGEHPIVHVGAGSHACYYAPGEYVANFPLPFLAPLITWLERIQRTRWYRRLYANPEQSGAVEPVTSLLKVPFIDYARGDGLSVGPGQDLNWAPPVLLNPAPDWVMKYRGLWGLYTRDPLAGEDAPAGPMYERDGTVRQSWHDPLGWAGLDKVPPPTERVAVIRAQQSELQTRQERLRSDEAQKSKRLRGLAAEADAIRRQPDLRTAYDGYAAEIEILREELSELRQSYAQNELVLQSLAEHEERLQAGFRGPPRAHIRRAHEPASADVLRQSSLVELWAALSVAVFLIGFAFLFLFARQYTIVGLVTIFYIIVLIEAWIRRRITELITRTALLLALAASLTLLFTYSIEVLGAVVLLAGGYILFDNLRELWT
ncbi:MAG: hypothetical protein R3300_05440 [Candidatus Promineifilaceae bacterium]|nr:hypothetical protein [Candidatus Promineifilaceae bacterium]